MTTGTVFPFHGEVQTVFPRGRACASPSCVTQATVGAPTVLSIYNPNSTCWLCTAQIERDLAVWAEGRKRDFDRNGYGLSQAVIQRRMRTLTTLLDQGLTWDQIGDALDRSPSALAVFWSTHSRSEVAA